MLEKKGRSPPLLEDSDRPSSDAITSEVKDQDHSTSEVENPYKISHDTDNPSSDRAMHSEPVIDHIEHSSDGGTSSSASTLSTSSKSRSKSRDSRHSSEEVIGEEDSDDAELSDGDDNKCSVVQPQTFSMTNKRRQSIDEDDEKYVKDAESIPGHPGTVATSSDVDSAFEDQPLVGRGHRNKRRVKQRKSSRGSTKSKKTVKPTSVILEPSPATPMVFDGEHVHDAFPLLTYDHRRDKNSPEIALFNFEVSPVQGSQLIMDEGPGQMILYEPPPLDEDDRRVMMDHDGNLVEVKSESDTEKLLKDTSVGGMDVVDPNQAHELLFLSHLEDKGIDEGNPPLPLTSTEISNHLEETRQQQANQSNGIDITPKPDHEGVDMKPDESEFDIEWVPPDGGWGWMVLLGSILVNILIPGTVKSFGVLFIEFIEVFKATPAAAAWIPALSYWLYSSTGPFATALAIKYSHRSVTIAGGLLAAAGLMLSYFATSIEYLYISYGLIGGLGAGLAYPIGVIVVGQYFRKRIGLANGLCTSGSALGSVLMPPLLRYLLGEYGYRGAILILGAILLNVCVAAMFYDPVDKHLKKVLTPRIVPVQPTTTTTTANGPAGLSKGRSSATSNVDIGKQGPNPFSREIAMSMPIAIPMPDIRDVRDRRGSGSIKKATFQIGNETPTADDSWSLRSNEGTSPLAARLPNYDPGSPRMYHNSNLRTRPFPCSLESTSEMESLFNSHLNIGSGGGASTHASNAASRSKLNLTAIPEDDDQATSECESRNLDWSYYRNLTPAKQRLMRLSTGAGNQVVSSASQPHNMNNSVGRSGLSRTLSVASNVSNSSFHYVSTIHHGSLLMTMQFDKSMPDFASTLTLKTVRQSCWSCWIEFPKSLLRKCGLCPTWTAADTTDQQTRTPKKEKPWAKFIDLSLLRDGLFIVILISSATTAIGYTNFIVLLPAYAIDIGMDKSDASLLLSVVAAFDFVGRIGGAALSDLIVMQRKWFYIVGLLGSGIALALLPLAQTYWSIVSFCGAFGLTSGIYIGVTAVILADLLGIDKLGSSYGITLFLNGIVQLAGPPICGVLVEYLDSYVPIFVGLGIILMFGAAIWSCTPFIERHRRLKQASMDECGGMDPSRIFPDDKQLLHLAVRRVKETEAV